MRRVFISLRTRYKPLVDEAKAIPWFENSVGTVYRLSGSATEIAGYWDHYSEIVDQTGHWPVVVGDAISVSRLSDWIRMGPILVEPEIEASLGVDLSNYFKARIENEFAEEPEALEDLGFNFDPTKLLPAGEEFGPHFIDERGEFFLALAPTKNGWEVPAHFGYGSWNDYPPVSTHVAILRD